MSDIKILRDYCIGEGSFGKVYLGINRQGDLLAVKTEPNGKHALLPKESELIRSAWSPIPGVVQCVDYWSDTKSNYLATTLCGPSIDSLHKICHRSFSLKTTLMLADQMLQLVAYYHTHDIIHRDLKPANFLINFNLPHRQLYLVDFGLAKRYRIHGKVTPYAVDVQQIGSLRYKSKHIHNRIESACRDDLYSLGYVIVYLFTGSLPWQGERIKCLSNGSKNGHVAKIKREIHNSDLVKDCMCRDCKGAGKMCPFRRFMGEYFDYLDTLSYDATIDYSRLQSGLTSCMKEHNIVYDYSWDWLGGRPPMTPA
jgi:serine/threonine protein kinase